MSFNRDIGANALALASSPSATARDATTSPSGVMARCRQAQALAGDVRRESILALMRMWGDAHPFVRWEAGRALADTVALYRDRPRLGVSWAASRSPTMSFDEFSALVREEMHAPEAEVRAATADALGLWQRATSVSLLLEALQDPAPMVRVSAAAALGRIGDQDAIKPLGAALSDPSVWVRRAAAAALGSGGAPHAVTDLRKALAAPQPLLVRSALVAALGRIGSASARNALLQHLRDDCPEIRWQAIRGLEQVGDVSALSRLEALLADETLVFGETIAARARAAIAAIEGREIGLWNALRKLFYLVRHRIAQVIASTAAKRSRIEPTEAQAPEE